MSDRSKSAFALESHDLIAAALHAHLLNRRRPTFQHDIKNVVHGLVSGTELLSKALAANSSRITPEECLRLLREQLSRTEAALHHLLDEVAPPAEDAAKLDVGTLIDECAHDMRHALQRFEMQQAIEPGLEVFARRSRVKDVLHYLLIEATDLAPARSRLSLSAKRDGEQMQLEITHPLTAGFSPEASELIEPLLASEGGAFAYGTSDESRWIRVGLPLVREAARAVAERFMIVDANRDAADSLAMLIQLEGFDAEAAYDLDAAVDAVKARVPAAVIIDVDGSIDDAALIARLRHEAPSTRIFGLSYSPESRSVPVDHYLRKPLDAGALRAALE